MNGYLKTNYAHNPLTVNAVGDTIVHCINHWATVNDVEAITDLVIDMYEEEPGFDWSARFCADGDWCKSAGISINGIKLMTWWK